MKSLLKLIVISAFMGSALAPSSAQAVLIDGTIGFGGQMDPVSAAFTDDCGGGAMSCTLANADAINFLTKGSVALATGDFSTDVAFNDLATFTDFVFDPSGAVVDIWSLDDGSFSFDLDSISILVQTAATLSLAGLGTVTCDGCTNGPFDPTLGTFNLTAQTSGGGTFSFSTTNAFPIPEPATLGLFGIGLAGLGFMMRRRQKRAA